MEPWGILTPHGSDTKTNSQSVAARALAQSQQFTGSAVLPSNAFPIRSLPRSARFRFVALRHAGVSRSVPKKKPQPPKKPPLLSVIQDLLAWRAAQGLSQSQAVAELNRAGVPVTLDSLQNWEIGRRKPNGETALALHKFLSQKPAR